MNIYKNNVIIILDKEVNKLEEKTYIHIQINENLKKELEEEAKLKGLSLNAYIRLLLIERQK